MIKYIKELYRRENDVDDESRNKRNKENNTK